ALALPGDAGVSRLLARLREAPIALLALELLNAPLARLVGAGDESVVLARLGGNEANVRAQRDALRAIGDVRAVPAAAWTRLRGFELAASDTPARAVARLSALPSRLADVWAAS